MQLVSFVIPCYRSEHTITSVVDEVRRTMPTLPGYDYEIVLVNDCSPDGTWDVIRGLAEAKGVTVDTSGEMSRREFKEKEYDRLADVLEENMDMKAIYAMLREARISEDD